MKKIAIIMGLITALTIPSLVLAIETAPRISDREIIERLTRLEEGQNTLRAEIRANTEAINQLREDMKQLREDMNRLRDDTSKQIGQLREDTSKQINQLREDMNAQFNRMVAIFTTLVIAIIGFAFWDRRTMIRPFETKVRKIEDEIAENRGTIHSLIDSLRALSKSDEKVAKVLKRFNLL